MLLIERNERPGRKILLTGKGRCNLTNNTDAEGLLAGVARGGKFLNSAFRRFSASDTMELFESLGVPLKTERGRRVFPVSDRAADIADALARFASPAVTVRGRVTELLTENGRARGVLTDGGETYPAKTVILATGGLSYPATGSTGDGYRLAVRAGHTVTPTAPSLVPLTCDEPWLGELQGLTLRNVGVTVRERSGEKPIFKDFGEMLFTHFGLSGPVILSASAYLTPENVARCEVAVDLKPALDGERLDRRVVRDLSLYSNREMRNALRDLLPHALIPAVLSKAGIAPGERPRALTRDRRAALVRVLKRFTVRVTGFRPIEEAVITRGGVRTDEVNPATMESKLCRGLYFAGELLDVDALTGGYNLQIAFSTGHAAGLAAAKASHEV